MILPVLYYNNFVKPFFAVSAAEEEKPAGTSIAHSVAINQSKIAPERIVPERIAPEQKEEFATARYDKEGSPLLPHENQCKNIIMKQRQEQWCPNRRISILLSYKGKGKEFNSYCLDCFLKNHTLSDRTIQKLKERYGGKTPPTS